MLADDGEAVGDLGSSTELSATEPSSRAKFSNDLQKASRSGRYEVLHCGHVRVHVLGVCHLSATSAAEARCLVEEHRPSVVCLELCEERSSLATTPPVADTKLQGGALLPPLSLATLAAGWRVFLDPTFWLIHLQLMALEALLGTPMGAEQAEAAWAGQPLGADVLLIDRPQSITMARTLAALADPFALWEVAVNLRGNAASTVDLLMNVAELELLILHGDLSADDLSRAKSLARRVIEALLDSPHHDSLGAIGVPIQEERDFVLSHNIFHATCGLSPGSCGVAILGAAHLPGVTRHFSTFQELGCAAGGACGVQAELEVLHTVPRGPLIAAAGVLLLMSCTGMLGRFALVRLIRNSRGATAAYRFNIASCGLGFGLGCFGLYRAQGQYNAVRTVQIQCSHHFEVEEAH